jgi:hypothetical protein
VHRNYVRWYNDRYDRDGRLFEHRPQWKAVTDDLYFVTAANYIAHNPVDAGLCDQPDQWRWSRRGWIAERGCPRWLATDEQASELKDGTRFRL